jgi:quercetin dioxygenase-like cupin family protein
MFKHNSIGRRLERGIVFAGAVMGSMAIISSVMAGECPADKRKADVREAVTLAAKDVTDTVLTAIDLSKEPAKIHDRMLRLRKLVIQPDGIVPWHSHGDRPAIIYIVEGEIVEYASNCSVPIVHKAGDVATETSATSHWWKNHGQKTVVLLSADLLRDQHDKHM